MKDKYLSRQDWKKVLLPNSGTTYSHRAPFPIIGNVPHFAFAWAGVQSPVSGASIPVGTVFASRTGNASVRYKTDEWLVYWQSNKGSFLVQAVIDKRQIPDHHSNAIPFVFENAPKALIQTFGTMNPMKTKIETSEAPAAPGLLSQAIVSGGTIYVAGQIHSTSEGKLVGGSTEEKVHQIMKNLQAILKAADSDFSKVVKVNVYVTDISELPKLNEVYKTYFTAEPLPVREAVCVKALPLGASVEISLIATKD